MNILKGKGILTSLQKEILSSFVNIPDSHFFYLTGGTALSEFYFGHRRSYDLDFFTFENGIVLPFSQSFEKVMGKYTIKHSRKFENFVEYEINKGEESTIVHFAYDSPFRFGEPNISEFGVKINDYKDLIVDKLLTFFSRWKHRDAVDLYLILKNEPVETLIEMAKQKDPGFDIYWFSLALQEVKDFSDEIEEWPVDMLIKIDAKELKTSFINLSRRLMKMIKREEK